MTVSRIARVLLITAVLLMSVVAFAAKRCPKCGRQYPDSTNFCTKDRTKLVSARQRSHRVVTERRPSFQVRPKADALSKSHVRPGTQRREAVHPKAESVMTNPVDGIVLVYIPAGKFIMGVSNGDRSEMPHSVYLSGYWIGKYEVTRGQYRKFIKAGGYSNPSYWSYEGWRWKSDQGCTEPAFWTAQQKWLDGPSFTQTDSHPVVGVSYYEAEAYCAWAGGHLPTEAQWEKAARGDKHPRAYPWGDTWYDGACNNWYDHNPAGGGANGRQTAPVGSYPRDISPYGCYDMSGNVYELCKDWYNESYYTFVPLDRWLDPQGPGTGQSRVIRGGSWCTAVFWQMACSNRGLCAPGTRDFVIGFRFAR